MLHIDLARLSSDGWSPESRICGGWVSGIIHGGNQTSIDFEIEAGVIEDIWTANATDWRVLVTSGECRGQSRQLLSIFETSGGTSAIVGAAWNQSSGSGSEGALLGDGTGLGTGWDGCKGPTPGGRFVLWHTTRPPGSLPNSAFGVRWSGFITPSFTSPYTFSATLSTEKANQERIKVLFHL